MTNDRRSTPSLSYVRSGVASDTEVLLGRAVDMAKWEVSVQRKEYAISSPCRSTLSFANAGAFRFVPRGTSETLTSLCSGSEGRAFKDALS